MIRKHLMLKKTFRKRIRKVKKQKKKIIKNKKE